MRRPSMTALAEFQVARLSDLFVDTSVAGCCECGADLGLPPARGVEGAREEPSVRTQSARSGFAFEEVGELPRGGIRWVRGEREESEAAPLCASCAAAIGLSMHHRRMLADDEEG